MAAYVIIIREKTYDPSELKIYSKMAPAGLEGHSVTFRALYGNHEVVEGPEVEGVAILEFSTFEEAKAWYNNPAYSAAREHRLKGGKYRGFIVEGWKPK